MRKIKSGKEEIIYLLTKVIELYKEQTGQEIVLNTNRKNYESIAIVLSNISNQLPEKSTEWETEYYAPEPNSSQKEYPYRKYDITGGQIKDALNGIVSNPRHFLVDACYVYLFGKGRLGFEKNPTDENLLEHTIAARPTTADLSKTLEIALQQKITELESQHSKRKTRSIFFIVLALFLAQACLYLFFQMKKKDNKLEQWKADMSILPYQPSQAEIDSLEGLWICYTGSPQARISDPNRYHKVVPNIIEVSYKDGYFVFNRYGASFNHVGYMQIESPGVVSIYSRVKTNSGIIESPRHSLMNLNLAKGYAAAMSASWNFDAGNKNRIVGIREIYKKLGKGGTIQEGINEIENASCQCKIIRWTKPDKTVQTFYLKNEKLDSILPKEIQALINESSILLNEPDSSIVLHDTTSIKK
jgi:hypothetical protein